MPNNRSNVTARGHTNENEEAKGAAKNVAQTATLMTTKKVDFQNQADIQG